MTSASSAGHSIRGLYLLIFLFLGGLGNYLALWLQDHGWNASQMGWLDGARYACIIVFPLAWGRLADRRGGALTLRWIAVGSALAFLPVLFTAAFAWVLVALTVFAAFRVGIVPIADTLTLAHVDRHGGDYGRFRIWGSWGFIAGGFVLAAVVTAAGRDAIPAALIVLLVATVALAFALRDAPREPRTGRPERGAWAELRAVRGLGAFFAVVLLWRICGQGLYIFLPLHLKDLGVSDEAIPAYWAVGVLSEIALLRWAPRLFGRYPTQRVLQLCFLACALQYGLTALITDGWWLYAVMPLHGLTFGVAYYTMVLWLGRRVPPPIRATAQAAFQVVGFGVGGSISAVMAGYLFEVGRGPLMFGVASGLGALTLLLSLITQRGRSPGSDTDSRGAAARGG